MAAGNPRAAATRMVTIGVFLLFILVPLYWVVVTSIKPTPLLGSGARAP